MTMSTLAGRTSSAIAAPRQAKVLGGALLPATKYTKYTKGRGRNAWPALAFQTKAQGLSNPADPYLVPFITRKGLPGNSKGKRK